MKFFNAAPSPNETFNIFFDYFVNLSDRYARQMADGSYRVIQEPVTPELVQDHLAGKLTLALPSLDTSGMCKWCAWDSDTANRDLFRIENVLLQIGFYPLREGGRSGRDGHLWLFFDNKVPAANLIAFDKEIKSHAKVADMEFFPKQASFNKSPNPLRAPFGINRKPEARGSIGWFEACPDKDAAAQLQWLAQQKKNSSLKLDSLATRLLEAERRNQRYTVKRIKPATTYDPEEVFADLEPELHGDYFSCECPSCGERRAYFYSSGLLICNRIGSCGFKTTCEEYLNR